MGGKVGKAVNIATLGTYKALGVDEMFEPAKPDFSAVKALTRDKPVEDKPTLLAEKRRRNVSRSSGGTGGAAGLLSTSTTQEDA